MLVLLDNARSAEQVRPLLTATPGSLVLITSRDALPGLVARDGARRITLGVLDEAEAVHLLSNILGPERVAAEPIAASMLARVCGYLPLTVRIAAAHLLGRPKVDIGSYVEELREGSRVATLAIPDDSASSLQAIFRYSYQALPVRLRRFFRLVGLLPGNDFTPEVMCALADISLNDSAAALRLLADSHLIHMTKAGRYAMHDLLREYAAQMCTEDEAPAELRRSIARLLDWYLGLAKATTVMIRRHELRVAVDLPEPHPPIPHVTDALDGMGVLDLERVNLLAAIRLAARERFPSRAVQLAHVLKPFFLARGLWTDFIAAFHVAVDAASEVGDPYAEAYSHVDLAWAYELTGNMITASEYYDAALRSFRKLGDRLGEADSLAAIGGLSRFLGRFSAAATEHRTAMEIYRELGATNEMARTQGALSIDLYLLRRHDDAFRNAHEALELGEKIGSPETKAMRNNLGRMFAETGRYADAIEQSKLALAMFRGSSGGSGAVMALNNLCYCYARLGRHDEASRLGLEALDLAQELSSLEFLPPVLNTLAEANALAGDRVAALRFFREALDIATQSSAAAERERAEAGISAASQKA